MAGWQRAHRIAFVFSLLFGGCIGFFAGQGHFDPYDSDYWQHVGEWCVLGTALGGVGGLLRQMLRSRD